MYSECYIAKSDPFIAVLSTPYAPNGLFEKIEHEIRKTLAFTNVNYNKR